MIRRADAFERGEWLGLLADARTRAPADARPQAAQTTAQAEERKLEKALEKVRLGEPSRARRELMAAALAPGNEATLNQLRDPARRPAALTVPFDPENLAFQPARPVELNRELVIAALRSAPRGASGGMSGTRNENQTSARR